MKNLKYSVDEFFELFLKELQCSPNLHKYYKFHQQDKNFNFRKAYFIQRLNFIVENIKIGQKIRDCGCGYGTTAIFLILNGFDIVGTTLEFYFDEIESRKKYWNKYGNVDNLKISYDNLFDKNDSNQYDVIIAQDTLHHLEPFNKAIKILHRSLKEKGYIIAIEENGNNFIQNIKLYRQRGNNRIIEIYDEKLKKNIMIGNENIRGLKLWENIFSTNGFTIDKTKIKHIRLLPPTFFKNKVLNDVINREQKIVKNYNFLKKYFFFGINFIAVKN